VYEAGKTNLVRPILCLQSRTKSTNIDLVRPKWSPGRRTKTTPSAFSRSKAL
jgi:hypothetical protein